MSHLLHIEIFEEGFLRGKWPGIVGYQRRALSVQRKTKKIILNPQNVKMSTTTYFSMPKMAIRISVNLFRAKSFKEVLCECECIQMVLSKFEWLHILPLSEELH